MVISHSTQIGGTDPMCRALSRDGPRTGLMVKRTLTKVAIDTLSCGCGQSTCAIASTTRASASAASVSLCAAAMLSAAALAIRTQYSNAKAHASEMTTCTSSAAPSVGGDEAAPPARDPRPTLGATRGPSLGLSEFIEARSLRSMASIGLRFLRASTALVQSAPSKPRMSRNPVRARADMSGGGGSSHEEEATGV